MPLKCELCARPAKDGAPFCSYHQPEFWNTPADVPEGKKVLVETDRDGVIRIFRTVKAAVSSSAWEENRVARIDRGIAVGQIRRRVFERDEEKCVRCDEPVTWAGFEMNEKTFKGKGGEVSLENCEALCHNCHQGSVYSVHGNRKPKWSKRFTEFQ